MGILWIMIFALSATLFSFSQVYAEPITYDDEYIIEEFAAGLHYPTAMDFVDGNILVTEKFSGKVILITDNGKVYEEPVLDVAVSNNNEMGLLGITSIPNHVYLYFTESLSGADQYNIENSRIAVYQYDWNGENLTNPILMYELPVLESHHHGGVMTKGLNNEVYFAIGDQGERATFQNIPVRTIYETGSIFKLDTENNNVEMFAMGIRNIYGLAVDPVTGYLWDTENGPEYFDEINLVKPGFNSGWINVMGPAALEYPASAIGDDSPTQTIPKPFENFEYSEPEFTWYNTVAPTEIAFPDSNNFLKYSDWLFVGDFNNGVIYKFKLNADREGFVFSNPELSDLVLDPNDEMALNINSSTVDENIFANGFQGVIDVKFHDDAMYVLSFGDGKIYKVLRLYTSSPSHQYQKGVPHNEIVCKDAFMPIMSKSGSVYCVKPKTAIIFNNLLDWSINHSEMPKIELKYQDLQELNFEHINLSNSDFTGVNFNTVKVSDVDFTQANLSYTDISGKDLTGTILAGADLSYANLDGVDLSGKDLTGTILRGTDLSGMDLTGTILKGADLSKSNLAGVDLSELDLSETILIGADLSSVILTGVDLSGKDLSYANLVGVDLSGKDLTGTILAGADLSYANLDGVDLSGKDLTGTILKGADLTDANLDGVDLSGKDLTGTILKGADLSGKDLTGTILKGADLTDANLTETRSWQGHSAWRYNFLFELHERLVTIVQFDDIELIHLMYRVDDFYSNLTGNDLSSIDLTNSILTSANLSGKDMTNANLTGVDLSGKDLTGTILVNADFTDATLNCVGHPVCV